jgi:hypothetical protein
MRQEIPALPDGLPHITGDPVCNPVGNHAVVGKPEILNEFSGIDLHRAGNGAQPVCGTGGITLVLKAFFQSPECPGLPVVG